MMISPEGYYESELKGKSIEQIEKVIRGLKKEMKRLTIDGDGVDWNLGGISFVDFKLPEHRPETKQEVLDAFRGFHIGEWKHKYVDPDVLDGTQWELKIEYSNGRKPAEYYGSNAFPFNFDEFAEFMGDIPFRDYEDDE